MKRQKIIKIIAVLLIGSLLTAATAVEKWINLQTGSTGLPGGSIRPLYIDNHGLLWIGGSGHEDGGFACYDGTSFLNVTTLYGDIFRGSGVQTLTRDVLGNLWVQTKPGYPHSGALMLFDGEKVIYYSRPLIITPLKLVSDADGILYAGGFGGLAGFENEEWRQIPIPGFEKTDIMDIQFDMNQDMWLLSQDGLFHRQGNTFTCFKPPVSFKNAQSFVIDFHNNKWIINHILDASQDFHWQLVLFQHGNWTILSEDNSALPNVTFEALGIDAVNDVWLCTASGVYILNSETLEPTPVEPLQGYNITSIVIDSSNIKWLGTNNGDLLMYSEKEFRVFAGNAFGLQSNSLTKLAKDRNGRMWIGSRAGGLVVADGLTMTPYLTAKLANKIVSVNALAVDSSNVVWAGFEAGTPPWWWSPDVIGLLRIDNGKSEIFSTSNSNLPANQINDIFVDADNVKWIATQDGVALYNDENATFTVINSANSGLVGDDIRAITIDHAGVKWIATDIGLNRFDGEDWACYTSQNSPLPDTTITALAVDENNQLWIGTKNNLAVLAAGAWTIYTMDNSVLPSMDIAAFDFNKADSKWIVTRSYYQYPVYNIGGGLVRINKKNQWDVDDDETLNPQDAEYDDGGNLWVSSDIFLCGMDSPAIGGGLYIYNPNGVQVPSFKSMTGQIYPLRPKIPGLDSTSVPLRVAPNPAIKIAKIHYKLDAAATVSFTIFDILGRTVYVSGKEYKNPGAYFFEWGGKNNSGVMVSSGIYICQMHADNSIYRQKLTLLR